MTPEQWSRIRTYEPSGSFDNPDPSPGPTYYQQQRQARLRACLNALWWLGAGALLVLFVLVVTAESRP